MKKLLTIFAIATISTTAVADQLIFSQFDGESTWNNVYVEVDNAADFVKPGVGFAEAQAGSESAGVAGVAGVQRVMGKAVVKFRNNRTSNTIKLTYKENKEGRVLMTRKVNGSITNRVAFANDTAAFRNINNKLDRIENKSFLKLKKFSVTQPVAEVKEIKEVKASWEQSLPARAIISVPAGVDMKTFIADFIK